jgi:undecaprenyl-diphosphatase
MPPDLTLFAATHLMVFDSVLAITVVCILLYPRHHAAVVCWAFTSAIMTVLSLLFFRLADAWYSDPRPFVVGRFHPLLAHTANNGFPSGYALVAGIIVFLVVILSRRWAVPFLILALLVDWARVGVGIHHLVDIAGSWGIIVVAGSLAIVVGPVITAILLPRIPSSWSAEGIRLHGDVRNLI